MKRFLISISIFVFVLSGAAFADQGKVLINDVSRLNPTFVREIYTVSEGRLICPCVARARALDFLLAI